MKIAGSCCTAAKFVPSCAAAVLVAPSPTQVSATRGSCFSLKVRAIPAITGTMSPTWEIGCSTPCAHDPTCRSRPREGESSVADRKSTRLNSSHGYISYAVFCLKKKKTQIDSTYYVNTQ